eukprot:SAG11_NODE_1072_length_5974_cov_1.634553_3_plen_99_part_00
MSKVVKAAAEAQLFLVVLNSLVLRAGGVAFDRIVSPEVYGLILAAVTTLITPVAIVLANLRVSLHAFSHSLLISRSAVDHWITIIGYLHLRFLRLNHP